MESNHKPRDRLAAKAVGQEDVSLWSVLKQCIGKELSKITMPISFNEPISFLQRLTEYMEYSQLLQQAHQTQDPVQRMQLVVAFAVSGLASNWLRLGKPFNPLLGETYQLERPDFRIVCEQVSHHPPVSAFHAESPAFRFHGSIHPKIKFWGKSVEIQPKGTLTVELPQWNETYTWSNVNCCVHNIIVGKLWIEQYGTMEIINHTTGHRCELSFKPAGWFSRDLHRIEGFIVDQSKTRKAFLYGKWTDGIKSVDMASYEEYNNSNPRQLTKEVQSGSAHTPRKMLAKLNSLTIGSFSKQSTDEANGCGDDPDHPPPELADGEVPKSDSSVSLGIPNSVTLWTAEPRPLHSADYYHFTRYAMGLNEMEAGMEQRLCDTDSRLRPDIRLLEEGDVDGAATQKTRLEEKQRDGRKSRKARKEKESPAKWFDSQVHQFTKQDDWFYRGQFWETQQQLHSATSTTSTTPPASIF